MRLELAGDIGAAQRHRLLAVDETGAAGVSPVPGQRDADVGVLGFAGAVDDAAHHRDVQRLDARIARLATPACARADRPGCPGRAPGRRSRWCARSRGRRPPPARRSGSPWSAGAPARPSPRAVRSPPGSGVSEMRIVSPIPCCSRMPTPPTRRRCPSCPCRLRSARGAAHSRSASRACGRPRSGPAPPRPWPRG